MRLKIDEFSLLFPMIFFSLIDAPFKKIKSSFYNKQNKNLCYISKEKKVKSKKWKAQHSDNNYV